MDKISRYNIARLQQIFALTGEHKDFLFIDEEHYHTSSGKLFRTDSYAVVFVKEGQLHITAGLEAAVITGPAIVTVGPSIIRSIERSEPEPRVEILFFTESFFLETQANIFFLRNYPFFEETDSHLLPLTKNGVSKLTRLYNMIRDTLSEAHIHSRAMIRAIIYILLYEIDALYIKARSAGQSGKHHQSPILSGFKVLLAKELLQQRSVKYYAAKLNVTPKYLSELVKEQTGRTAGEWIDQAVILEAKVLLQNKEMSVTQVSDHLNFSDPSVFGKFFKVHTGQSPLEYRKSLL